jgi:hypothetical protein
MNRPHPTPLMDFPISIKLYHELLAAAFDTGFEKEYWEVGAEALADWLRRHKPEAIEMAKAAGYQWKQVFLPNGTLLRTVFNGKNHHCKVEDDKIHHEGRAVSPSGFVNAIGGIRRNAWKSLWVLLPDEKTWKLADSLRPPKRKERARARKPSMPEQEAMPPATNVHGDPQRMASECQSDQHRYVDESTLNRPHNVEQSQFNGRHYVDEIASNPRHYVDVSQFDSRHHVDASPSDGRRFADENTSKPWRLADENTPDPRPFAGDKTPDPRPFADDKTRDPRRFVHENAPDPRHCADGNMPDPRHFADENWSSSSHRVPAPGPAAQVPARPEEIRGIGQRPNRLADIGCAAPVNAHGATHSRGPDRRAGGTQRGLGENDAVGALVREAFLAFARGILPIRQ